MTVLEVLPDGCIKICHEGHCGVVSSYHLVEPKLAQLRQLATSGVREGQEGHLSGSGAHWHAGVI